MTDLDRIEAQAARERARLQLALGDLRDSGGAMSVATQLGQIAMTGGKVAGRKTVDAARRNPLAFGVLGVGLGLLVTGAGAGRGKADARLADAGEEVTAAQLRAAREAGLEDLPAGARLRVLEARDNAIRAQERLEQRATRATRRNGTRHALTIGALALGAGAIAMAALSGRRRRTPDAVLLAERDASLAEAASQYQQEHAHLHPAPGHAASVS